MPPASRRTRNMRNLGLDLLRIIAVLLVLGRHLRLPEEPSLLLRLWKTGGWIGVDIFFVLSGFLVSGLIFREYLRNQSVDLKRFLIRRGFKIYPAFYALIAFTVATRLYNNVAIAPQELIGELLFLQNYLGGIWNHTWSLAVEEHFYIGIALLCWVLLKRKYNTNDAANPFRSIPLVFAVVASLCILLRAGNLLVFESFSYQWFLFATHIRIDSLMFGVLLAYLWHFRDLQLKIKRVPTLALIGTGACMLLPAAFLPLEEYKSISLFGVTLFYLGSGALVLGMVRLEASGNRALKLGGALGAASYSIYLWHMPVASGAYWFVRTYTTFEWYGWFFCFYFGGSLACGWVMNKLLEWPILKVRDRLFPKNKKQPIPCEHLKPSPRPHTGPLDQSQSTTARRTYDVT